jgi:hypothetical protein
MIWGAYIEVASSMAHSLILSEGKPEVRERILAEANQRRLADPSASGTLAQWDLPYTAGVVRESLRLIPPGGWLSCGLGGCGHRRLPDPGRHGDHRRSAHRQPDAGALPGTGGLAAAGRGVPVLGSVPRRCSHPLARPGRVRQSRSWAWSVWLRWFSNQRNGPAHPLQHQRLSRSPEVSGPPRRSRGGGAGGITPLQGTRADQIEIGCSRGAFGYREEAIWSTSTHAHILGKRTYDRP